MFCKYMTFLIIVPFCPRFFCPHSKKLDEAGGISVQTRIFVP